MQAAKPISGGKKCQKSQQSNGGTNCTTKDKSIAQRVMDVTVAPNSSANSLEINHAPASILMQQQQPQSGSNNSVENDHEVEAITNRAMQKVNISPVNSNTSSASNVNANMESVSKKPLSASSGQQFAAEGVPSKSSSSLIPVSPISKSAPNSQQAQQQQQQQERFKANNEHQSNAAGSCQMPRAVGSALLEQGRIGLDTKVPHPHKLNPGGFQPAPFQDDEVSYYNDTHAMDKQPAAAGGSLDKSARPKLLLAASQQVGGQIMTGVGGGGASSGKQPTGTQASFHQQKLLGTNTDEPSQEEGNNKLEVYQNESKENNQPRPTAASYDEHNYMTADYDVLYDVHYHNAPVVEKEAAAKQQQKLGHHEKDTSSGYSRYQEIASPAPQHTSEPSPKTNSNNNTRSTQQMVSISTSPKAKSAPATPCNVTPTAFHQTSSHLSSMLNPTLANTMPPDIRKNISSTCRVLPSSIGLSSEGGGQDPRGRPLHLLHHQQQTAAAAAVKAAATPSASSGAAQPTSYKHLDSLIKRGELALAEKNHISAIKLFSQCIKLATEDQNVNYLKKNFKIYSQRAEAHFKLGNYNEAIDDSMAARELNPKWTQAYYLQGQAQFMIGQYADSLAVFSFGLTQDPNNEQLFGALIDAALSSSSSFRQEFEPKFNKLKAFQLDRRPFVVVAVLGQELLAKGHSEHAAIILESALKLGSASSAAASPIGANHEMLQMNASTTSNQKKFKSSILSTISLAYCMLRDYEKAICYMNKELDIETELEDINGQCRVLSNLGYTYYKVRKFDKSLEAHRRQLNLAMRTHLYPQASQALNAIGHVHAAKNDHSNALTSHTRCLDILKQLDDDCYAQFKGLLAIGHVHLMLNDLNAAEEKFDEANQLLKQKHSNKNINHEEFTTGSIMINFNLAHLALRKQSFMSAIKYYESVLELTQSFSGSSGGFGATIKRATYEMRACNGLGQACRLLKKFDEARNWFEKQLRLAKTLKNQSGQSQALCNLGMICQQFEDHHEAWRLFDENLKLVDNNFLLKAYAHSYMGSAYYLMNHLKEARDHYEISSGLFKELGYFPAEQRTIDQNLASIKRRTGLAEVMNSPVTAVPTVSLTNQNSLSTAPVNQKKVMMAS